MEQKDWDGLIKLLRDDMGRAGRRRAEFRHV